MATEYKHCFACGEQNPIGLKLNYELKAEKAYCDFKLEDVFCGYPGVIHGGIIATILDESMAKIILYKGITAVTIEMNIKYRKSLAPHKKYQAMGEIKQDTRRVISVCSTIYDEEKNIIAEAEGKFFKKKV